MKLLLTIALPFAFALLTSAADAAIHDTAEPPDPEVSQLPHRVDPGADPWWSGFNDPILGSLQRVARDRVNAMVPVSAPSPSVLNALRSTDARIAVAYVGIRTMEVRLALLDDMQVAIRRNRQLLEAAGPTRTAGQELATLDARMAAAAQLKAGLLSSRAALIDRMVESTGMPNELVQSVLAGGDAQASGLIFPTFAASAERVVAVAPSDAVRSLHARTAAMSQQVATRQRQANTAIQRWKAGLASELDALWAGEALLSDEDQLSEIAGQLDLAWIDAYMRSRSGAALPARSDAGGGQQNAGTP